MKQNNDNNLIQAALDGDAVSFSRLCERYYALIVAIAYSRLADRNLAEDAAQEAMFVAYRNLEMLKNIDGFGRWLTGICRNIAIDMAKERKRNKLVSLEDGDTLSGVEMKNEPYVELVRSTIDTLPEKTREIILLRYYNDMGYREIADLLGISEEAVNGRLRRAKKIIAKKLNRRASIEVDL